MSRSPRPYPPPHHLLRDLGIVVERDAEGARASLEITPEMLDGTGRLRVGVLATAIDVVAGETAVRAALPGWIATSDLSVYAGDLPATGRIEVSPRLLRRGRQTVILEACCRERDSGAEVGASTIGFAILPARNEIQKAGHWAEELAPRTEFALAGSGLRKPVVDAVGIEFDPGNPAIAHLHPRPYLVNSLGAIQGGGVAILIESTADHFATATLGRPTRVRSLAIHYLKLARVGPIRAEARSLAQTAGGLLVHVELFDEGATRRGAEEESDAPLTVATLQVDMATPS
jgi:acyl-coenzyme A thioesterase PaaI-like protein